jgi:hypothetical protein
VVSPVRLLVGGFAVKLRYGGPHARRRHVQALPTPATKPVYQASCFPAERAITSGRLRYFLAPPLLLRAIIAGQIATHVHLLMFASSHARSAERVTTRRLARAPPECMVLRQELLGCAGEASAGAHSRRLWQDAPLYVLTV